MTIRMASSAPPGHPASTALIGLRKPKKYHILVVDDENTNVEVLSRFLIRQGYDVTPAFNGQEALDKIKLAVPDLIILDNLMPVMDGLTVCRKLRADFATRSIPIIFLTALNALQDRLQGLRAGADFYMEKPFILEEIKVRLESALSRRQWDLGSHPLTHLPGSPAIEEDVWKRIRAGTPFAFAYIDIDHFKAYNDVYGYESGDKVIKHVASSMIEAYHAAPDGCAFAGHVGGDDFVFLSTIPYMKTAMLKIAKSFDAQRTSFYHRVDVDRGTIKTKNRQGRQQYFPLMTLSVAVVSTASHRILHHARLVDIASELKRFTKAQDHKGKSLVLWDRRAEAVPGKPND